MVVLAGDIGGTNARLAGYEVENGRLKELALKFYTCDSFTNLEAIIETFLSETKLKPTSCALGVAGPVINGEARITNLPWRVNLDIIEHVTGAGTSALLNDLESTAYGIFALGSEDIVVLQEGIPQSGNACVIAAGTGLGEAGLIWTGHHYLPLACEGGHASFSPTSALEAELLQFLQKRFGHVSYERVVSGQGLVNIYSFTRELYAQGEPNWLVQKLTTPEAASAISQAGLEKACQAAEVALDLFIRCYASEAGNLALKIMARGGVYLAGGIAPKLISCLREPRFIESFAQKGRMGELLKTFPIRLITNEKVSLLGAAWYAAHGSGAKTPLI